MAPITKIPFFNQLNHLIIKMDEPEASTKPFDWQQAYSKPIMELVLKLNWQTYQSSLRQKCLEA